MEQKSKEYEERKEGHDFFKKYNINSISNSEDFPDKDILEEGNKVIAWLKDNGYFEQIRNVNYPCAKDSGA
jgi:hypothetical protein